jgi:hypothetical protein
MIYILIQGGAARNAPLLQKQGVPIMPVRVLVQ